MARHGFSGLGRNCTPASEAGGGAEQNVPGVQGCTRYRRNSRQRQKFTSRKGQSRKERHGESNLGLTLRLCGFARVLLSLPPREVASLNTPVVAEEPGSRHACYSFRGRVRPEQHAVRIADA